jgi:hypothetical protein
MMQGRAVLTELLLGPEAQHAAMQEQARAASSEPETGTRAGVTGARSHLARALVRRSAGAQLSRIPRA